MVAKTFAKKKKGQNMHARKLKLSISNSETKIQ
jgi:hypothetical protein